MPLHTFCLGFLLKKKRKEEEKDAHQETSSMEKVLFWKEAVIGFHICLLEQTWRVATCSYVNIFLYKYIRIICLLQA